MFSGGRHGDRRGQVGHLPPLKKLKKHGDFRGVLRAFRLQSHKAAYELWEVVIGACSMEGTRGT